VKALYHHRTQGRDVEAVHIHGLAGGLEQLGYHVEIVGPPGVRSDPDAAPAQGPRKASPWSWIARHVPQLVFEMMEIGYNAAAVPRLWRRCKSLKPAVLYERYALYNAAGVVAGWLTRTPVVLEVNDTVHMDRERQGKRLVMPWLAAWFERRIFGAATGIVVVSGYLKDHLISRGISAERIRVTPNAVDVSRFDPAHVDGDRVREQHGLGGKTVIGFAGSFAKWHGVDLLVRAFASIAQELPHLHLLMVGDGARRPEAEALAAELGVGDQVVFTGRVPHAEIPEHVMAMDIGVMPSSNLFGSPMKVFEYMALGRPPVAPRYRPLEEAIDHGQNGLLFEPDDLDGLTECLRTLAADRERRLSLGAAARQKVLSHHQWIHNAQAVLELLGSPSGTQAEQAAIGTAQHRAA
jgi:glycosyltransferase involved in cell wall biosynthesis